MSDRSDFEQSRPWREIRPGMCVQTKSGVWTIAKRSGDTIRMLSELGEDGPPVIGRPDPDKWVTVLLPGHPRYIVPPDDLAHRDMVEPLGEATGARLAVTLATVRLGAHVVAEIDLSEPNLPHRCPRVDDLPTAYLAAHLYAYHRLEPGDPVSFDPDIDPTSLVGLHEIRLPAVAHTHTLEP